MRNIFSLTHSKLSSPGDGFAETMCLTDAPQYLRQRRSGPNPVHVWSTETGGHGMARGQVSELTRDPPRPVCSHLRRARDSNPRSRFPATTIFKTKGSWSTPGPRVRPTVPLAIVSEPNSARRSDPQTSTKAGPPAHLARSKEERDLPEPRHAAGAIRAAGRGTTSRCSAQVIALDVGSDVGVAAGVVDVDGAVGTDGNQGEAGADGAGGDAEVGAARQG